jgi:hypothetical protein
MFISGSNDVGGLVGYGYWDVADCFWDTQTSARITSAAGTGLTTAEMQTATTFLCWLLKPAVWTIDEGKDYPRLWWQNAPGEPLTRVYYYGGGTGTQADPYLIYSPEQLSMIGSSVCDLDKHFNLMADIDLSAFDGQDGRPAFNIIAPDTDPADQWFQGTAFTGVFDGNGHTISHLTITGKDYVGLFGQLGYGAEVRDLGVVDVNITALAGYHIGAITAYNLGAVTRCYSTGAVTGSGDVGGLVGWSRGSVTQCYSTGAVTGSSDVGGLVGWNGGHVINCYSIGAVSAVGEYVTVGGMVGNDRECLRPNYCQHAGVITGSFWDTQTSGQATSAGGTEKTTAEMQTAGTFLDAGWDFVNVWGIGENQTYPYLRKYSAADINQDASVNFLDLAVLADNWLGPTGP